VADPTSAPPLKPAYRRTFLAHPRSRAGSDEPPDRQVYIE
jgi:hypothetical protein